MSELIAIGYPDTTTAPLGMEEVEARSEELVIHRDAVAVIIRDETGKFKTITNAQAVGTGAIYGMFWGPAFGTLFFAPFLGMPFAAPLDALMGQIEETAFDRSFRDLVRDMLKPGTSALFLVIENAAAERVIEAISHYGGRLVKNSVSPEAQQKLQRALYGDDPART